MSKLHQKAHIAAIEQANIINAMPQNRQALHSHHINQIAAIGRNRRHENLIALYGTRTFSLLKRKGDNA